MGGAPAGAVGTRERAAHGRLPAEGEVHVRPGPWSVERDAGLLGERDDAGLRGDLGARLPLDGDAPGDRREEGHQGGTVIRGAGELSREPAAGKDAKLRSADGRR